MQPSLLEGRTFEIEDVLNDFGWTKGSSEKLAFDELQASVRQELSYVEAGSWLGAVENNDDRVVLVSEMMDRVMTECEELDCLLTLYNVELGVCQVPSSWSRITPENFFSINPTNIPSFSVSLFNLHWLTSLA